MTDLITAAQQALEALRFYADCSHQVTLTGFKNGSRIDWDQERDRLEKAGYRFSHENHNSTEEYVEDGRRAQGALNNLEEALAQQAEPVAGAVLGPLPEPAQPAQSAGYTPGCIPETPDYYTAEQMREYAMQALAELVQGPVAHQPDPPQRLPLTEEEILLAAGWERAEMWMKLAPNFPVDEARKETIKNARAVEKASWEKNHG